ncbi:MAG: M1 family peptidase [Bacteroidetes bacterium SW_10_40_5]|nr:MAG: M1 family peptidase [Bacteroidetes bacterium SW_10_40_5]
MFPLPKLFKYIIQVLTGLFIVIQIIGYAQAQEINYFSEITFSKYDTLRGSLNTRRTCYDVHFYDLNIRVNPESKTIKGSNTVHYEVESKFRIFQVDLFANMKIDSITANGSKLNYKRDSNVILPRFPDVQEKGGKGKITVYYRGKPKEAENPPWDGGFVWENDEKGRPWIGVACEGIGASLWWPNKDHLSEEPDSMKISCEVPKDLTCVSNGRLTNITKLPDGYQRYSWFVSYPINNYNVTLNIGHYTHFEDQYVNENDTLELDYYVLDYNQSKARDHFLQVPEMLECFEEYFGPYPFPKDGYGLVETPYWGMEHQGAIAYGNNYENNELGFDYIIIHESAHEWWGNSISTHDHGALWIHESFTTYAEALFVECKHDYSTAIKYLKSQKPRIQNIEPILGPLGVNFNSFQSSDMYYKGSWMLHTLRNTINDDEQWFHILRSLNRKFSNDIVTTQTITAFINDRTSIELSNFFKQYLRHPKPPKFQYRLIEKGNRVMIKYRWVTNTVAYKMPISIKAGKKGKKRLRPTQQWQTQDLGSINKDNIKVATDKFYVIPQEK